MRDTIFKTQADMPSDALTEIDTPVRVRQVPRNGRSGALSTEKIGSDDMDVVNCCRPRRGHDY